MTTVSGFLRGLLIPGMLLAAAASSGCIDDKAEPEKGEVDDSSPPGSPFDVAAGKSDGGETFSVALESAHPYANNLARDYVLALDSVVPSCTRYARVHFASLRTEANYDFVTVKAPDGSVVETFDGRHDGVWSDWVAQPEGSGKKVTIRLETDYSITDHGFRIDAVEVQAHTICPLSPVIACSPGYFDITPTPSTCECRGETECAEDGWVQIDHMTGGGFTGQYTGKRVTGTVATTVVQPLDSAEQAANVGTVDREAMQALVTKIIDSGILDRPAVSQPSNWNETLEIRIGTRAVSLTRPAGSYTGVEQEIIAELEALFICDGTNAALTCGEGFSCGSEGACVEEASCFCPAIYDPVCGEGGHTYSSGCAAGCAHATVVHDGECGITGDPCGTILGLGCLDNFKCRYATGTFEAPYPDAGGSCVAANYCDAPPDCAALPHIAVPGTWACEANTCAWKTGPAWQSVPGFSYSTAHPYPNNQNVWKELYAPVGATKMRLVSSGTFATELDYDKLEVWAWRNASWVKVKTYTGSVGPALTDEFAGQYFYLHFVSDYSVTARGFDLTAQYAN